MSPQSSKFAVVVPYRNRRYNLAQLILHLQWYLVPGEFDLLIVEQADGRPFNRGCTLNIGFDLAHRSGYSHYAFHDVDLIPLEADYSFSATPVHLSTTTSQYLYEPPYQNCFGGVVLFNKADFEAVNGFSNHYWGWGREDYDLLCRCAEAGLRIERRQGRFLSLPHEVDPGQDAVWAKNNERFAALRARGFRNEGLNSLNYEVVESRKIEELPFTGRKKALPAPVSWWSVALHGDDVLETIEADLVTEAS
jgi:hypothetical protein